MLILNRYNGQKIYLGKNQEITITVKAIRKGRVSLGIQAPLHYPIVRDNAKKEACHPFIQDPSKNLFDSI
ncbi:MAG: Global regulator protein family [Gammaproteobacteria bacterium]|jgi:carbon storage regulator CsrA|nr:Global regulator protein family [Gammaproteobacteria bacterium]